MRKRPSRKIKGKISEAELLERLDIIQNGMVLVLEQIAQLMHFRKELLAMENDSLKKQSQLLEGEKTCLEQKELAQQVIAYFSAGNSLQ